MDLPFYREYELPWTSDGDQERKFQRQLGIAFLVVCALSIVWPFIPTPDPDPYDPEDIPPRIAQLLLEEKPLPPPVCWIRAASRASSSTLRKASISS